MKAHISGTVPMAGCLHGCLDGTECPRAGVSARPWDLYDYRTNTAHAGNMSSSDTAAPDLGEECANKFDNSHFKYVFRVDLLKKCQYCRLDEVYHSLPTLFCFVLCLHRLRKMNRGVIIQSKMMECAPCRTHM